MVASLLASLTEGLSVGLVIPLLEQSQREGGLLSKVAVLGNFVQFFNALTLVQRMRLAAVVLILIVLIRGALLYAAQLVSVHLQLHVERHLGKRAFEQLHTVELKFIHRQRIGDLLTTLGPHLRQSGLLIQSVAAGMADLFTLAIYGVLMLFISWQLTLFVIGLLGGLTVLMSQTRFSADLRQAGQDEKRLRKRLQSITVESLSAMKLIHLHAHEKQSITRFAEGLQIFHGHYYRGQKLIHLTTPLFTFFTVLVMSSLLIAGTFLLPGQTDNWLGQIVLFLVIAFRLMRPAANLNQVRSKVVNLYPALQSVLDLLDRADKPYLRNGDTRFKGLKERTVLENVNFRYESDEPLVLKNVTFEIPVGKMTAVVGPSGAGKSTLVDLIARLYDVETGCIRVDGVDLRDLNIESWRKQLAVVSQEAFIFNDTVRANLKFAKVDATDAEIFQAAHLAQAHDFITALPQGYDTLLGDRGVRLSGGQQQRISIARAVLANPQLLILDEATSELDSETERAIQVAVEQYGRGRTVFVIAHRLSTIRRADSILVLAEGRVAEQGTHEELMRKGGQYWQLVQGQNLAEEGAGEGEDRDEM